jgi:hypothetical protein
MATRPPGSAPSDWTQGAPFSEDDSLPLEHGGSRSRSAHVRDETASRSVRKHGHRVSSPAPHPLAAQRLLLEREAALAGLFDHRHGASIAQPCDDAERQFLAVAKRASGGDWLVVSTNGDRRPNQLHDSERPCAG